MSLKKLVVSLIFAAPFVLFLTPRVLAWHYEECLRENPLAAPECEGLHRGGTKPAPAVDNPFGAVEPPPGVTAHGVGPEGLVSLLNVGLKLLVVVAGLWALLNLIVAGYQFMTAGGDPKNIASAWARIWQSLTGLIIVVSSFLIAAILGQLLFGDPAAILNPKIFTP